MFKEVITYKGFWKSVLSLGLAFVIIFVLIKWAIAGFNMSYITKQDPLSFFAGVLLAGFVYGFFVSFGKFRSRIKNNKK